MKTFKTTRKSELVTDKLFTPLVPALDAACPGWKEATVFWMNIEDGTDLIYQINDVFIRGWDMTGAINNRKRRAKKKR